MNTEVKNNIIKAAKAYLNDKEMSQRELQRQTGINYLNSMLNGVYTFKNPKTGELSEIDNKYFNILAEFINFNSGRDYWPMVETEQSTAALFEFEQCKNNQFTRVLIGESGSGKSYLSERFKKAHPLATYHVTCNDFDTVPSLLDKLLQACNITCSEKNINKRLERLKSEIWKDYRNGKHPVIIWDEAENLKLSTMKLFKALYDYLIEGCSMVLIDTDELIKKFEKCKTSGKDGFPQFYRRVKAGIRYLPEINPQYSFTPFFENKNLTQDAKRLLIRNCENYGVLKDYLLPALKEANGQPITADLLKTIHNNLI